MKNLFSPLYSLVVGAACALALGSCSRADYAMLPKSSSYLGTTRAVAVAPADRVAKPAETVLSAPVAQAPVAVAPEAAPAVAAAPVASAPAALEAAKEESAPSAEKAAAVAALPATAATVAEAAPAKMTRVQKFAASKLLRTASKVAGVTQFKQKLEVAKTQKVSGNLRIGIILILIGLLISLFSRVNSLFGLIGGVVAVIGLIFIILWLLDNI